MSWKNRRSDVLQQSGSDGEECLFPAVHETTCRALLGRQKPSNVEAKDATTIQRKSRKGPLVTAAVYGKKVAATFLSFLFGADPEDCAL